MSNDLLSSLNSLKKQLDIIEESVFYETNTIKPQATIEIVKNLQGKLKLVEQSQDSIIQVDVRGEICFLSRATVSDCLYNNIIQEQFKSSNEIVFIDIDRKNFNTFLNMMRHFNKTLNADRTPSKFPFYVKNEIAEDIATLEILEFFSTQGTEVLGNTEFIRS